MHDTIGSVVCVPSGVHVINSKAHSAHVAPKLTGHLVCVNLRAKSLSVGL